MKNYRVSILLILSFILICCHTDQDLRYSRSTFPTRELEHIAEDSTYDHSAYLPYPVREELPLFPSKCLEHFDYYYERRKCSFKELIEKVHRRVRYPSKAERLGLQGRVIISFIVANDGELKHFKVLRDIGGGCGQAAIRAVKSLPKYWIPGRRNDVEVEMVYILPVKFELPESE